MTHPSFTHSLTIIFPKINATALVLTLQNSTSTIFCQESQETCHEQMELRHIVFGIAASDQRKRTKQVPMRVRNHFGMIDTIYEEEHEFSSTSSSSLSPQSSSSSTPPLHPTVKAWSLVLGREADMLIRVQGTHFHLHKDCMTTRSSYLKRHLIEVSDFTLSTPLNITADTFAAVDEFCYSHGMMLTVSYIAAMRAAAGLLGMTEVRAEEGENLCDMTELYFERMIGIYEEYASMILHTCMPLLLEAQTTSLVSRLLKRWFGKRKCR